MNLKIAETIINELRDLGVRDYCLCAGARNSPFIVLFEENQNQLRQEGRIFHLFEERSASFFALGLSQQSQRPVAIITTSGTAATELISAAVEAYYTETPLIFITADRPSSYRETGAPQAINQIGIFSHYARPTFHIEGHTKGLSNLLKDWNQKIPLHLNVSFDEPLLGGEIPLLKAKNKLLSPEQKSDAMTSKKEGRLKSPAIKSPLFIIGGLKEDEKPEVLKALKYCSGPFLIESLSGLRGHPQLEPHRLQSGDGGIQHLFESGAFDAVVRIGGIPTTRLWRDLENRFPVPVLNFCDRPWRGLARQTIDYSFSELDLLIESLSESKGLADHWQEKDRKHHENLLKLCDELPKAEPSLVRSLSDWVHTNPIYLGNSLPVRQWDLIAKPHLHRQVHGNRGANGIDGQVSSFLGWAPENDHSFALLGDLTTLYDLSAPWLVPQTESKAWTLIIMNNGGGQIFQPLFGRESFLNRHALRFEGWASLWQLSYECLDSEKLDSDGLNRLRHRSGTDKDRERPQILEVCPDEQQTLLWRKEAKVSLQRIFGTPERKP